MNSRTGSLAAIVAGLAGIVWFWLELAPQRFGFEDTDNPSVSLGFVRAHPEVYAQAGISLLVLGLALVVASVAVLDLVGPRCDAIAARSAAAFGLFAAAFLFMHGVGRLAAQPVLYIDGLDHAWGETAYLVLQIVGVHGFAQGGVYALCLWVVAVSVLGFRGGVLPVGLAALAVIPAFRIVGLSISPFADLPDELWIFSILAIPGVMLWCVLLGLVLLRRSTTVRPASVLAS